LLREKSLARRSRATIIRLTSYVSFATGDINDEVVKIALTVTGYIFLIAFAVGLLQLMLAWLGDVHVDFPTGAKHPGFGYLRTTYWSLSYLILVPLAYVSAAYGWRTLVRRSSKALAPGYQIALGAVIGLVFGILFVGGQVWRSLAIPPNACQWNSLRSECMHNAASTVQQWARIALFGLAYTNHFLSFAAYSGFLITIVLVSATAPLTGTEKAGFKSIVHVAKIGVAAYLLYLALLRSAKVEIALLTEGKSAQCTDFSNFMAKCASPYFEVLLDGLVTNVVIGLFLLLALLFCLRRTLAAGPEDSDSAEPLVWLASWQRAFAVLGRPFRIVFALAVIGIAVPPAGGANLLIVTILLTGVAIVKSEMKSREAADS